MGLSIHRVSVVPSPYGHGSHFPHTSPEHRTSIAIAQKKAGREANEGVIGSYIHTGSKLGVLVEVNCESDFVARTDAFQELVHDIAMHIAAADPRFIRKEDVNQEAMDKERAVQRARALAEGKPESIVDKMVEGRMSKF